MFPKRRTQVHEVSGPDTGPVGIFGVDTDSPIQSLPAELLGMVFDYLPHTGKLISRLVCNKWNLEISSSIGRNSYFVLNSEANHQVLLDSSANWTKIRVSGYTFRTGKEFKSCVTSLHLILPEVEFDLKMCLEYIVGFPNLKNLTLWIHKAIKPTDENLNVLICDELENRFGEFVKGLLELEIYCPFKDYVGLLQLLTKMMPHDMNLARLALREEHSPVDQPYSDTVVYSDRLPFPILHRIISSSSKTLKHLQLTFRSLLMRFNLYKEVISKLCEDDDLHLLESLEVICIPRNENSQRDFEIYKEFVLAQPKLKILYFPYEHESVSQNFLLSLPSNLRVLNGVMMRHIGTDFAEHFKKIQRLGFRADLSMIQRDMLTKSCPTVRILWLKPSVTNYNRAGFGSPLLKNMAEIFPNVVELEFVPSHTTLGALLIDSDLQTIIQNFQGLRSLRMTHCINITDFGVSGVSESYCEYLLEKGSIYTPDFEIPSEEIIGHPISSLKKLERLSLGDGSTITDAGIFFGFQFGSTLKSLSIKLTTTKKISDWGLHWLGKGNPGLEEFDGTFNLTRISVSGEEIVRKQLPLLKSTKKFSWELRA